MHGDYWPNLTMNNTGNMLYFTLNVLITRKQALQKDTILLLFGLGYYIFETGSQISSLKYLTSFELLTFLYLPSKS